MQRTIATMATGLRPRDLMIERKPGGALATVILGILGSLIGAALLAFLVDGVHVTPISFLGFVVALGGTTLLLISYRILGGGAGLGPWLNRCRHFERRL